MNRKHPKLFKLEDVSKRAGRAPRTVYLDMSEEGCPLRWTHKVGRQVACTLDVLELYLEWLEARRVRPIDPIDPQVASA